MGATAGRTLASIDIGTSKIALLVAELDTTGALTLLGGAQLPSQGMRQGVVVDLAAATEAIAAAVARAEEWQGAPLTRAYVSLGGPHLAARTIRSAAPIIPAGREVVPEDIAHAMSAARASVAGEQQRELVHLIPSAYALDGQAGIRNPLGMSACTLEATAHAITGAATHIANLSKCLHGAGIEPEGLVAGPFAAHTAIPPTDPTLCTVVADIGAETTSIAVAEEGALIYSAVLPLGGASITQDIALALRLPRAQAEALKRRYGHCLPETLADDELVELLPLTGEDEFLPRQLLASIIAERAEALCRALGQALAPLREIGARPASILLTGGCALLPGLDRLLAEVTGIPAQVVRPQGIIGLPAALDSPALAVAAGLLQWGARQTQRIQRRETPTISRTVLPSMIESVRRLIRPAP